METFRGTIKEIRKDIFVIAGAMIIAGILFVAFPDTTQKTICYCIAAVLAILGIVRLIAYFKRDRMAVFTSYDLVAGAVLLIVGIYIFVKPDVFAAFVFVAIGIIIIADGFLLIQYAVDLLRIKSQQWWILLIIALITIAAGVVVVINPFTSGKILLMFAGILLIIEGVSDILVVLLVSNKVKNLRNAIKEAEAEASEPVVEAEVIDED